MKLYLIGVNHYDPLGRQYLSALLRDIGTSERLPPLWIAVEYDEQYHAGVVAQRPTLRRILLERAGPLTNERADMLAQAMGYDGDTHMEVFPGSETIWLDEGREVDPKGTAEYTFGTWLWNSPNGLAADLQPLRKQLQEIADGRLDGKRDRSWINLLSKRMENSSAGWATVVVGSSHTDPRAPQSLASMLGKKGVTFEIHDIHLWDP